MSDCTLAEQMIFLTTSDGVEFRATVALATMSQMIRELIKGGCAEINIELPDITADILIMVIEYCEIHVFKQKSTAPDGSPIMLTEKEIENWDREFLNFDPMMDIGIDLMRAAYYLLIPELLDLVGKKATDELKICFRKLQERDEAVKRAADSA